MTPLPPLLTSQVQEDQLLTMIERLDAWLLAHDFAGVDPYDALNSPLAPILTLNSKVGRIALTQILRRAPINLRPFLFIRPGVNPKALGLALEAYCALAKVASKELNDDGQKSVSYEGARARADLLVARLLQLQAPTSSGAAWGYNFPWQNRYQLLPRYTPTLVNTSFISHALLDYADLTSLAPQNQSRTALAQKARNAAYSSARFILHDLRRDTPTQSCGVLLSYTPLDDNFVYNANFLGASLLARILSADCQAVLTYEEREEARTLVNAILVSCMTAQNSDGSWRYGRRAQQSWIDSFHTGFNLESLRRLQSYGFAESYRDAYALAERFYAENFFDSNGAPWYYAQRPYLYDVHAPMEALYFFSRYAPKRQELIDRIFAWTRQNLYDSKHGYFYFRKTRFYTIKIPYLRWSQSWALRALCQVYATRATVSGK
ncbi:MAG: hypothetical protein Q4G03_01615 [Planctomycetia bacterium]|nr:hypothetical protein [Planctomycetia bacterium]